MKYIEGNFKVEWRWIGEGYNVVKSEVTEYDPHNKDMYPSLRFYCFEKIMGKWEEMDDTSFATKIVKGEEPKRLRVYSELIVAILKVYTKPQKYLNLISKL